MLNNSGDIGFSPFNRWKALYHCNEMEQIAKGKFLPPFCVCTDPSNICNQKCYYCDSREYMKTNNTIMSREHLLKLAAFYFDWGVKATIMEGGGEPLVNNYIAEFITKCHTYDIETGLITNGSLLKKYYNVFVYYLSFCGISFDSPNADIYRKIRGVDHFNIVTKQILTLNKLKQKYKSKLDVNIKVLICQHNYKKIYEVAKLAKELGCNGVHIKPVATLNVPGVTKEYNCNYMKYVNDNIKRTLELSDENFNVYFVLYKFGDNMDELLKFKKCNVSPISGVFGADGNFWICYNRRGIKGFKLTEHYPDPYEVSRIWGSKFHKDFINKIKPANCMRCGLTNYNEIYEKGVLKDSMFKRFL